MPFYCQNKRINKIKRNIKSRKINKQKRKMLVSKHTITVLPLKVLTLKKLASFFSISFSFHFAQLFSNFFKYSSSNLLSFYSNKILAVYFSSNSLLLNSFASGFNSISTTFCFSFLFSTHYTSSSFISFSNFFTKFITFFKFSNPS